MKSFFSSIIKPLRATPFTGRTIAVFAFVFLLVKQLLLLASYGKLFQETSSAATFMNYVGYFVSDFVVCLIILGLVAINSLIKKTVVKLVNNFLMILILLLFILDAFTMFFFQSRLSLIDLQQFITPSLSDFSGLAITIIVMLCIAAIIVFFVVQTPRFKKSQKTLLAIYFFLFALGCFGIGMYAPGGFQGLPENIISLNVSALYNQMTDISDNAIPDTYPKFFKKIRGEGNHPNVIIIFAESLSPIDSLIVGGVHDNLPYFDLIQKQGISFTNFINNGCTSDTAHIGLLMGVEPIKLFGYSIGAYSGFKSVTDSLPEFFNKQGYASTFISTVDLNFLGQKAFLSGIGFTEIIGTEAFEGQKKYVFNAAPDHVLYNKALDTIRSQTGSFFLVLQSISFHKPYNTPYGKTEADALRYADKSLYYFYLQLKKSGFFDNGILAIVSDHRKMESLEKDEKEALGEFRYARGLATIVGTGIAPGSVNRNIIQQTDIFSSMKQFISNGLVTISKIFNDAFSAMKKRDRGFVYCRYFQKSNKYTVVESDGKGKAFDDFAQMDPEYRFIHTYISSYIAFQEGSSVADSGTTNMIIIAHQGSPKEAPENSLEGFQIAKKDGANGVEMDVSYTQDKQLVVLHGEQMRATASCQNDKVGKYTLDYIHEHCPLKNGEPIRTLEEMLKSIDGMFDYYFIDIKVYATKDAEQEVNDAISVVQKLGMQDRAILSSYDKTANYILGSHKNIIAARDTYNSSDIDLLDNVSHQYFMTPYTNITGTMAQQLEDLGKKFVTYTINTTGDLEQAYNAGVRMIMTDDVPGMKEWSERRLGE